MKSKITLDHANGDRNEANKQNIETNVTSAIQWMLHQCILGRDISSEGVWKDALEGINANPAVKKDDREFGRDQGEGGGKAVQQWTFLWFATKSIVNLEF